MGIASSLALYRDGAGAWPAWPAWLSRHYAAWPDRRGRVPDLKARLIAALEARRIEIEAGKPWPPARNDELARIEELLNAIKFEELA